MEIVTSLGAARGEAEAWRLSEEPVFQIGVENGPEEYQLFRVGSAVRLGDGRIVVANLGSNELRFYGSDGRFRFARGGEGEGPGEFRSIFPILILADSLFVFDSRLMRLTVFSTAGDLVRISNWPRAPDGSVTMVYGLFADGHLLARTFPATNPQGSGLWRDTVTWLRFRADGVFADSVGWFLGDEHYIGHEGDATFSTDAPFGRASSVLAAGERLYYGSSDSWQIEVRAADGTLKRILRRPIPNPPVSREEGEEFRRSLEERLPRMPPMWRRLYADIEPPETKPAYGRFLVDAEGNLWVSKYTRRRSALAPDEGTWVIFDPDGRLLGEVETPASFRVLQVGGDWLLGVSQDEMEVERVQLFSLLKE